MTAFAILCHFPLNVIKEEVFPHVTLFFVSAV